jgi:hypothetical protein
VVEQGGELVDAAHHLHAFDIASEVRAGRFDDADRADGRA